MLRQSGLKPKAEHVLVTLFELEQLELLGVATVPTRAEAPEASAADAAADRASRDYAAWIAAGHHGEMDYLERHRDMKYDAVRLMPGARSVLVAGMNYYQATEQPVGGPAAGRVARYAWGRDYHNALGKRLKRIVRRLRTRYPEHQFRSFVDASPLSERFFAEQAGIGFTAKNTLTVSSLFGSWFFLGEIVTTLPVTPTAIKPSEHGQCPRGCFRCGGICPTGALYAPYRIDARRCISYLTIEHRGVIPEGLRSLMGTWVFGCDLCQEVCPLNVGAKRTLHEDFTSQRAGEHLKLADLLSIASDADYRATFAGTPLLRPGRAAMIRNAAIAAANAHARDLLPRLRQLTHDPNPIIREHCRWAVDQL